MSSKRSLNGEDESPNKRTRTEPNGLRTDKLDLSQQTQERNVGITVFVSPQAPGFECVLKQRYTDFLVNEILPDGQVLHLTDLTDARKAEKQTKLAREPEHDVKVERPGEEQPSAPQADEQPSVEVPELSAEDRSTLVDIFGEEVTPKIVNLHAAVLRNPKRKPRDHNTVISEVIDEKSKRTEAHMAIRRIFNSKLQTETLQNKPGVIALKASPPQGPGGPRGQNGGNRGAPKGKMGWHELGGEYLHFILYKENKDTMEVLSFIASQVKIPARNFEFAGTKDRRGVTVQKVAVFRMRAEAIAGLNRMAISWRVGGFEYKKHGLALGDLAGNEFLLTLRDCHFPSEDGLDDTKRLELAEKLVSEAAESFKTRGFLNYYGLQRFGSFSTGTHITGLKILQGDLEGAVNSILAYSPDLLPENVASEALNKIPRDDIARADVIRRCQNGSANVAEIRDMMPRRFSAESAIMQYLSKKDRNTGRPVQAEDWQGALMQIPRSLRLMYVHAYQSLVWNKVAGKRWELFGDKVVEGDLVIVGENEGKDAKAIKDEIDEDGEPIVKPAAEDSLAAAEVFTRARPLTDEEARSGRYTIFDLVLPQPGFDVEYPANEIGKYYEEFMGSEEGGGLDPHKMRRSWKDASLSGSYRKMMARPLNGVVECRVAAYEEAGEQMVETDLEKLRKKSAEREEEPADPVPNGHGDTETGASNGSEGQNGNEQAEKSAPSKIAVVMKFQLGSSQYATMALRELCKGGAQAYKPEFNTAR